jgi:uncharacterized protein (DUF362 family)
MKNSFDRRDFLKRSAWMTAGLLAGKTILRSAEPGPVPGVEIAVVEGNDPEGQTKKAFAMVGGIGRFVRRGARVILLPNPQGRGAGLSTNAEMVAAVVRLSLEAGAASVAVSSAHAQGRWSSTGIIEKVRDAGGTMKYPGSSRDWVTLNVPNARVRKTLTVIRDAVENDVLIDMPVFKQHDSTYVTCNIKNLMGFNADNGSFHQSDEYLHQAITDLASIIHPHISVVDATTILTENGPFGPGRMARPNKVYVGTDMVALDALCCGLLRVDPKAVPHLLLSHKAGLGNINLANRNIQTAKL